MKVCEICGIEFEKHASYANHIRWKHRDTSNFSKTMKSAVEASWESRIGKQIEVEVECEKCKTPFKVLKREKLEKHTKRFCSPSCSNGGRIISDAGKKI